MQSNGSPPKISQLGGSIKATSLTHKHNKILTNLKSLQYNIKDKIKDKNKDKEPLIKSSSSNITIGSILPSELLLSSSSSIDSSSQVLSFSPSKILKTKTKTTTKTTTEAEIDNVIPATTSLVTSLVSTTLSSSSPSSLSSTSSSLIRIDTTNSLQKKQQQENQEQQSISISTVQSNTNNNNFLKSNAITSKSSLYPITKTTINKDNNNSSNNIISNTYTNNNNNSTRGSSIISSCSISNNNNNNNNNSNNINNNNNSSIIASNKHQQHQHCRDQYHQPTYYPYSYSRNTNSSLGGGGGGGGSGGCIIGGNTAGSSYNNLTSTITTTTTISSTSLAASSNSYHLSNNTNSSSSNSSSSGSSIMGGNSKRHHRKHTWGTRERAGMSFLIVIAFFAVFGLIILTELFMIDDKNRGGMVMLRHGNINNRMIDSIQPDYDNPKYGDDYDQSFGFLARSKNNDEVDPLRLKTNRLAWNEMLESKLEQTLPHYPTGEIPTDGIWKVVNGTRFKFFVYSAYYDTYSKRMTHSYDIRRMTHIVRVIGATKTRRPEKVFCRLWYTIRDPFNTNKTKYTSATLSAKVKIIREHWNLKYSAVFVLCPVPPQDTPFAVSIVSRLRAPPGNILQLRNTNYDPDFSNRTYNQIPDKMAVCVKPFHFNYDQALYLMEYLELNSLLGVSHFTFYNHTIGPHATCVLQHYASGDIPQGNLTTYDYLDLQELYGGGGGRSNNNNNRNINMNSNNLGTGMLGQKINRNNNASILSTQQYPSLTTTTTTTTTNSKQNIKIFKTDNYVVPTVQILPWDLRMRSQTEIRTEGLFAALNDCLYRNMYRYKYLALVDVDEFLMPKTNDSLSDLLRWLNKRYNIAQVGSYSFQNAFFYLQFADDSRLYKTQSKNPALRGALVTQKKTRRRLRLHPQKQRSKYIVNPEAVVEAGNHFVWDFIPGKKTFNVPADAGILHHYRVCEFGGDDCVKVPSLLDRTAIKYTNRLIERVEKVYNYLKKPCKLDNLPPAPTRPPPTRRKVLQIRNYNGTNNINENSFNNNINNKNNNNNNKNNQNLLKSNEIKKTIDTFLLLSKNNGAT